MDKKRLSQKDVIEMHLKRRGHITQLEANKKYGISRLSAVIFDLRQEGLRIVTTNKKVISPRWGKTIVAKYVLVGNNK